MLADKTVFILGAGASKPFGFPTGKELIEKIYTDNLKNDRYLRTTPTLSKKLLKVKYKVGPKSFTEQDILNFQNKLYLARDISIDEFLNNHDEFRTIGKLAIAQRIMELEHTNNIFNNTDWYGYFFPKIYKNFENFGSNPSFIFITFNYDRSLEHYLFNFLINAKNINKNRASEKISSIPIYHIYGQLGYLPWQKYANNSNSREYTYSSLDENLIIASKGIHIMYDNKNYSDTQDIIQDTLDDSEVIHFLGFGFDRYNLKKLNISSYRNKISGGTCFNFTPLEIRRIEKRILGNEDYNVELKKNYTVLDYLRNNIDFD